MLKRLSTIGRKKKDDVNGVPNGNGAYANGGANGVSNGAANGAANGVKADGPARTKPTKRMSFARTKKQESTNDEEQDRSVTRGDVESSFQQFQQLIHASSRPLPTQTGDGAYLEHEAPSSLLSELRTLGFKDFKTLREVISSKATGALVDDKTMIMERVIQASTVLGPLLGVI